MTGRLSLFTATVIGVAFSCGSLLLADEEAPRHVRAQRPITRPSYDAAARQVALFDGLESGRLGARVIAKNATSGNLLISNQSAEPLTVVLPESFVAVPVLKQFQPLNNNAANGFANGLGQQPGQQVGQQQSIGGGMQAPGNANGNAPFNFNGAGGPAGVPGLNGNGLFSIPAEKTVKLTFQTVCLEHGKSDPTTISKYKLIRTEAYTQDPVLQQLLAEVGRRGSDTQAYQAAVWHVANGMTWQQLAAKQSIHIGQRIPFFDARVLSVAQTLVQSAKAAAESQPPTEPTVAVTR